MAAARSTPRPEPLFKKMSTTTRSHWFWLFESHSIAVASSSAVPMTWMGAISSSAATRFSRITGLSSTMNARSCVMPSRSSADSRDSCRDGGEAGKEAARADKAWTSETVEFERASLGDDRLPRKPRRACSPVRLILHAAAAGLVIVSGLAVAPAAASPAATKPIVVGSKRFTESYVLGEIVTQAYVAAGRRAEHRQGLGNTGILEQALASGAVDIYPEYTGTIVRELLKRDGNPSLDELNRWLAPRGLVAAIPLGFNNTYALAMSEAKAKALGIARISDLATAKGSGLTFGFSHEFLERADGWPALQRAYAMTAAPIGLDHGLAYDAVAAGKVDVIDVYSTDAKLGRLDLRVLDDDRAFFPKYDAVLLMRAGVDAAPLRKLAGTIDAAAMIAMNGEVEIDGRSFAETAHRFLVNRGMSGGGSAASTAADSAPHDAGKHGLLARLFAPDFGRLAREHLLLVFASLAAAIAIGVPIGIAAWRWPGTAGVLLGAVAVLQTVPSLALLAFLIAIVGTIGVAAG